MLQNFFISLRPMRMMAAFVLPPYLRPSQKPAPMATMFLRAPQSSTPTVSLTRPTLKEGSWNASLKSSPFLVSE